MKRRRHVIDAALDFTRMPALARTSVVPPIPPDILEVIQIAAASPEACRDAAAATGESTQTLIEAARFYLQQLLFRPDANCQRVLGLPPGASRATARKHMRWLLQWLHPDRNDGLDAVYAERVVTAWREISTSSQPLTQPNRAHTAARGKDQRIAEFRLPWIKQTVKRSPVRQRTYLPAAFWAIPGLLLALAIGSAAYFFGFSTFAAMVSLP